MEKAGLESQGTPIVHFHQGRKGRYFKKVECGLNPKIWSRKNQTWSLKREESHA
jgi:hypothetical protein